MLKKVLSFVLSLCVLLSIGACLAGCNGSTSTLKWAMHWTQQADEDKVLEVVNKRLEKLLPGAKLEFTELVVDKWTQQMAAGEVIDIAWTGYEFKMLSEIKTGSFTPLDDLITEEDTPNLYKEWKETYTEDYQSGTYKDVLYAIPNQQPIIGETPHLKIPEPLMQYFDVDAFLNATYSSPTTTRAVYDVLDKYFEKIWAAGAVDTDVVSDGIDITNLYNYLAMRGYASITGGSGSTLQVYKKFNDGKVELKNLYETEEYMLFLEYAAKWYNKGYISKNVLVNSGASGSRLAPISAHGNGNWFDLDDPERGIRNVTDSDGNITQYYINIEPSDYSHNVQTSRTLGDEATYLVIPYTSKNPELAIKLLDLLRSPKGTEGNDLLNLIVYGFEKNSEEAKEYGTWHYTLEGDDLALGKNYTIQPATNEVYGKPHWVVGNAFLTYRTPNILAGQQEYAMKYETETIKTFAKTPLYGFSFDGDSVDTELSNISSVISEYNSRLYCGVDGDGYMKTYNEYTDKLKSAGIDTVRAEVQKQVDAFLNGN